MSFEVLVCLCTRPSLSSADHWPCRPEDTIVIRQRRWVEKIIQNFDHFLGRFGHSFEDIEVGWHAMSRSFATPDL